MPASWFRQIWQPASAKNHIAVIHFETIVKDKCSHLYKAYLKSCQNLFERAPLRRRLFLWMNKRFLCLLPIFFTSPSLFSTNIFQRERVGIWLPGVTGWNQAFLREVFQSPSWWQPKKRVSFAGEVRTMTALHSEAEAEESHQEQGERAEGLGDHDTST